MTEAQAAELIEIGKGLLLYGKLLLVFSLLRTGQLFAVSYWQRRSNQ
jgi:hypothetical protein